MFLVARYKQLTDKREFKRVKTSFSVRARSSSDLHIKKGAQLIFNASMFSILLMFSWHVCKFYQFPKARCLLKTLKTI